MPRRGRLPACWPHSATFLLTLKHPTYPPHLSVYFRPIHHFLFDSTRFYTYCHRIPPVSEGVSWPHVNKGSLGGGDEFEEFGEHGVVRYDNVLGCR